MKIRDLMQNWETKATEPLTARSYAIKLPLNDAARILALARMYPARSEEQLLREIIGAALDEIEAAFPYIEGDKVVAEDEYGDPIYEDAGFTPRFAALTREYRSRLEQDADDQGPGR
jgi:hypothetical protein